MRLLGITWNLTSGTTADTGKRDSMEEAIRTDCVRSILVYPDTPVGSYEMLAPTLFECIELALANDSSSLEDSCFSLKGLDVDN